MNKFHDIKTAEEETGWLHKFQLPWDLLLLKITSLSFTCRIKYINEDHKIKLKID